MNTDTPRTDSEQEDARNVALDFNCKIPVPDPSENCYVVSADFARTLERELNDAINSNLILQRSSLDLCQERDQLEAQLLTARVAAIMTSYKS